MFLRVLKISGWLLIFLHSCNILYAQENLPLLAESEFSVNFDLTGPWSLKSAIANRNYIKEKGDFTFEEKHIELNQFVDYRLNAKNKLSFGTRYRFKKAFNSTETDELRFIQQYNRLLKGGALKIGYRVRQEERFREELSFRSRLQINFQFSLGDSQTATNPIYIVTDTEAIFSYGKFEKPNLEQRLKLAAQHYIFPNLKVSLGPELRYSKYLSSPKSELYIETGISLYL